MLRVTNLAGFGGGARPAPTRSYGGTATADSPASPATFSAMAFGSVGGNRRVAVAIAYLSSTAVSSVTIGGVTATQVEAAATSASARASIWVAEVASGTSGDVVVTGHDGIASGRAMAVSIYSLYNLQSDTARSHGNDVATPFSISLTTAENDIAVGCVGTFVVSGAATHTWTNLTEDADGTIAITGTDFNYSMASASSIVAGTLAASVVPTSTNDSAYVAANWGQ